MDLGVKFETGMNKVRVCSQQGIGLGFGFVRINKTTPVPGVEVL